MSRAYVGFRSRFVRAGVPLKDPYLLAVLAGVGLYSWYWSQLTIDRFYAMHAAVYDLGAFMQQSWLFTQPQIFSPAGYVAAVFAHPVQAILSPLAVINSYPLILSLQSVALGAGAVPLYVIARQALSFRPASLLISGSYLLYSPMAGVNWFDAHFIAFFIPLFLSGYAFYIHKHWTTAGILLFLAATSEIPDGPIRSPVFRHSGRPGTCRLQATAPRMGPGRSSFCIDSVGRNCGLLCLSVPLPR